MKMMKCELSNIIINKCYDKCCMTEKVTKEELMVVAVMDCEFLMPELMGSD